MMNKDATFLDPVISKSNAVINQYTGIRFADSVRKCEDFNNPSRAQSNQKKATYAL